MQTYAFFDVDSLEISPNGRTYVCHPRTSSISETLFEVYSIISGISAPYAFSVDLNRNTPDKKGNRRDYHLIPMDKTDEDWKASVPSRYKFYIQREASDDKEKNAIFNNNENVLDFIKLLKIKEWFVFGNGLEFGVDHVITKLLETVKTVKFVPELIVPGEGETEDQLNSYFEKWKEMGAIPATYNDIALLTRTKMKHKN